MGVLIPKFIKWRRQWGGSDKIVWVNVAKFDAAWKESEPDAYIAPGVLDRWDGFAKRLIRSEEAMAMSHVCLWEGGVSFTDGRHRFSWCRDRGVRALPVTATPRDAALIAKRYGSQARTCRLPKAARPILRAWLQRGAASSQ